MENGLLGKGELTHTSNRCTINANQHILLIECFPDQFGQVPSFTAQRSFLQKVGQTWSNTCDFFKVVQNHIKSKTGKKSTSKELWKVLYGLHNEFIHDKSGES